MELLLNLIWIVLAGGAFLAFSRRPYQSHGDRIPYWRSLLALACILFLLFPIVSASDDLHPTQAMVEDATKRVQHLVSPLQLSLSRSAMPVLPVVLFLWLMLALSLCKRQQPAELTVRELDGWRTPSAGRAPPFVCG